MEGAGCGAGSQLGPLHDASPGAEHLAIPACGQPPVTCHARTGEVAQMDTWEVSAPKHTGSPVSGMNGGPWQALLGLNFCRFSRCQKYERSKAYRPERLVAVVGLGC